MSRASFIFTIAITLVLLFTSSCPVDGGGPVVVPGMITVDGVSDDSYVQSDGTNSFTHNISTFQIAEYEVTYSLWKSVRDWAASHGYSFANAGQEGNAGVVYPTASVTSEPVTSINWRDAIVWCNAYSEREGLTRVYYTDGSFTTPLTNATDGLACDAAVPDWSANGFRLPTEGEWQFAASNRGATPVNYASGATAAYTDFDVTILVAWFGNSTTYGTGNTTSTQNVGTTTNSNELLISDMSGNVSEWCWDWLGTYPVIQQNDYRGPGSGSGRLSRGGSWLYPANSLQIGDRANYAPEIANTFLGFRLARTN